MRRALPVVSVLFPLLVTAIAFKWFPRSDYLGAYIIPSLILGWIGMGFSSFARRWVKVLVMVVYPFVMWVAVVLVMILVYGVPGL